MTEPRLRSADESDAAVLAEIYNHFVLETTVTFETSPVSAAMIADRMQSVSAASLSWIVCEVDSEVVGYAYSTPWKGRYGYRTSCEVTVYVRPGFERRGIGTALYTRLIDEARAAGMHSAVGGIALPNDPSIALHESLGFEKVAHFQEIGTKFGEWIDVGYWQKRLTSADPPD